MHLYENILSASVTSHFKMHELSKETLDSNSVEFISYISHHNSTKRQKKYAQGHWTLNEQQDGKQNSEQDKTAQNSMNNQSSSGTHFQPGSFVLTVHA